MKEAMMSNNDVEWIEQIEGEKKTQYKHLGIK